MAEVPLQDGYVCGWCGEQDKRRLTARHSTEYDAVYVRCDRCIDRPFIRPYGDTKSEGSALPKDYTCQGCGECREVNLDVSPSYIWLDQIWVRCRSCGYVDLIRPGVRPKDLPA